MKEEYKLRLIRYLKNIFGNLALEYTEDYSSSSYAFHEAIELSKSPDNFKKILSIMIFHQSSIEFMKELIIYCNFFQQLALYPNEIYFNKITEKTSYSEIKKNLNSKIVFNNKEQLLSKINLLNELRTKYAHRICFDYSVYGDFENIILENLFEKIFKLYQLGLTDLSERIVLLKSDNKFLVLIE